MVAINDIQQLADRIAREFRPRSIVLFGSHAYGNPTLDSDVDLMVIIPHAGKSWRMATEIRNRVRPRFPVDLIVRSPQQVRDRISMGDPFLTEISQRGQVLYEADHG